MNAVYPARYKDRNGEEPTALHNDGNTLSMTVRGIDFEGSDFDGFEPKGSSDTAQLSLFTFDFCGELCACVIQAAIPIPVITPDATIEGILNMDLELGNPSPNRGIDREALKLQLVFLNQVYTSKGLTGWFEDELANINAQLPVGTTMKTCFNCAFSDYSPYGHGLFGGLACFRGNKAGYRAVLSKRDLLVAWDTMTEFVQETHVCAEFEQRSPGTGYRG